MDYGSAKGRECHERVEFRLEGIHGTVLYCCRKGHCNEGEEPRSFEKTGTLCGAATVNVLWQQQAVDWREAANAGYFQNTIGMHGRCPKHP